MYLECKHRSDIERDTLEASIESMAVAVGKIIKTFAIISFAAALKYSVIIQMNFIKCFLSIRFIYCRNEFNYDCKLYAEIKMM